MNSTEIHEAPAMRETPTLERKRRSRVPRALTFGNIGAVYVWLIIVAIFSIWIPHTFDNLPTVEQILNSNAVTALIALSLLVPLATAVYDLSVAYVATLSGVAVAHFVVVGVPLGWAIALTLVISAGVGVINGFVVVVMRINSFIATLATGSLISALITMLTNNVAITAPQLDGSFAKVAGASVSEITVSVFYMLAVAVVLWFLLEQTATGRRMYATGFNDRAARLARVRVDRLRFVSLMISATIAGFAGIVLASVIESGSPSAGIPYLLPAFAAAFLGATQLRGGRFNAFGTLIAVLLLGTGTTGLSLAAAPAWSEDMFTGVVLIAALAITGLQQRSDGVASWRRLRRRSGADMTLHVNDPRS
jgi:ribose transport system permease protein